MAAETDEVDYSTVAGLIIDELGRIPQAGEELDWKGMHMRIISLDGHRMDKVRIQKTAWRV